ncbi:ras association domain-containing protein 9 isoform X2 [Hyperolius riggenbachi]|uniref:ras association domain-containing protein 9 isoform X2 n=1 Tax=Hyperolius riggenbachi TaxID=752182 RepID=UPI0035A35B52
MDLHKKHTSKRANQKTRSSDEDVEFGSDQITVWIGNEEKVICGLTKHTSTANVIDALLEEKQTVRDKSPSLLDNHREYCIVESWKGFHRILPPSSKILKVWKGWSVEQSNVSFNLIKSELLKPCSIWRTAGCHKVSRKHLKNPNYTAASVVKSFPIHKQKRIVRKTFRKLEKMKKDMDLREKNNMGKLLHIIDSQDHTIKQFISRIEALDRQIEEHEACIELDIDEHLVLSSHFKEDEYRKKKNMYLIDTSSYQDLHITDEINTCYMHIKPCSTDIVENISPVSINQYLDTCVESEKGNTIWETYLLENVRQAFEENLQLSLRLHSLFSCIQKEINHRDYILLRQRAEYEILKQELNLLSGSNKTLSYTAIKPSNMPLNPDSGKELVHISAALSNMHIQSDTDSDTGISSTRSQDSDPAP